MKSVNELGISPMPWVAMDNGTVASQDTDGELFEVCDCWGCRDEANARLIAAAPELYDMCHNLLKVIDKYRGVERVDISCEECLAIIDNARRILAKAAGEEANNGND